ncbi:cobalamin synthesis protein P47K [Fischerella sp. NIES-3754]|nr:cobalamin synthesis protein P47K [Fischerella sp. NIES-3754]BCX10784.1 MAG: hypothetical protein KatS3mg066_4643 [Fischerella sp.]
MTQLTVPASDIISDIPKRGMPVTIITGFLVSGKTTLLNQILKNKQDLKVAVLVNEFGDINIDSQLLVSMDEDMVELSNGCICCTINDGLVDAVYRSSKHGFFQEHGCGCNHAMARVGATDTSFDYQIRPQMRTTWIRDFIWTVWYEYAFYKFVPVTRFLVG